MQHEYDATFTDEHGTDEHGTDEHGTDEHVTDENGTARLLGIHIPFNNASGKTVASESTRL
jgi:hypothetical protein